MDLSILKTDQTKEVEGVWVDLDPTTSVKVTYTDGKAYRRALQKKLKPYTNLLQAGGMEAIPEGEQEQVAVSVLVDHVVLDWKGVTDNGVEIPFSKEAAKKIFTEVPAFRRMVENAASDISNFRQKEREADEKN